jgi:antitoxin YefM
MITSTKHQAIVGKNGKLEILTSGFPEGTAVEVIVLAEPEDEIAYLLGNETNHKGLLEAIDRVELRQDLVTFTPEAWNAQYNV